MARSVVRTQGYSLQQRRSKNRGFKAFCMVITGLLLSMQAAAQYIAYSFNYRPELGSNLKIKGYPIYPLYRLPEWVFILLKSKSYLAYRGLLIFSGGFLVSVFLARTYFYFGKRGSLETLHGSAHWATMDEVIEAGLLNEYKEPQEEGVVVGGIVMGGETVMLRHNGKEHILCFAPTRSGKGISLVLPTLLDGWKASAFVLDIKGENFALTAGYRQKELGHKILKLDFTDPFAIEKGSGATFNPLEEIHLDYDFKDGIKPDWDSKDADLAFEMVPSGTYGETASIQQIVAIIIDPHGKGMDDHWLKTASAFMLGCITHLLYKFKNEEKGCPCLSDILSELSQPGVEWQNIVRSWMFYPHLGQEKLVENGIKKLNPKVHPIVAEEAQSILSKPEKEAGSVLSTAISNLALFRDPVVSRNTGKSSFKVKDLMNDEKPVSLYLVVNPNDQLRLTPLTRLFITQIIFSLVQRMDFKDGRSVEGYKHRLLLLLDEFPSLGRLELFEKALGFIGGYGLKAYIILQDLTQLYKAYSKEESIRAGCHIQVAFAPNNMDTAEYLSKSTGQMTIIKENYSESVTQGKKTRSVSLQEVQRPLLTPDECRRLPGAKKDANGDVIEAGDMLIFPAGFSCIYGRQTPYFMDEEMSRRSKISPPLTMPTSCGNII